MQRKEKRSFPNATLRLKGISSKVSAKVTRPERERLPRALHQKLQQIAEDAGRHRRPSEKGYSGILIVFSGPPGTGKTLAAKVLASKLGLDLYRIDLNAVVNKYIGETEKNIERLLARAEDNNAILLFDEADALLGKRTEIEDANDRYANIGINFLLQRLEDYHGLAILCTNLRHQLDPAFLRRARFVVEFNFA